MSFQNLRSGSQVFILDKQAKPTLHRGTVVTVSAPMPKYGGTPAFGQMPEMVVDMSVKVGDITENYQKLPALLDTADSGVKFIATAKEAMNAEVMSCKQRSMEVLSSVKMHEEMIEVLDGILNELNPEYAERVERDKELKDLRSQVENMTKAISDLTSLIADVKTERRAKN